MLINIGAFWYVEGHLVADLIVLAARTQLKPGVRGFKRFITWL